ncbi:lamin tail domain-containing protein [Natrialba asiatica]|uniref:LTD domain-containing protein n=1 Tax=Natrialba asiatica (strain ATCC 700177 / DSM 12278 / JCM 9576 / FERM P-10747 / NBRC 102637 / 172P1) TaxID=29540 RepID=M0B798_NATA1|nr:lamin tail domain-containing protein [Natrialba asiatica]ELZ06143.1 hypothetical protein C481_01385 [Natrialba asiatica DSM 12278]
MQRRDLLALSALGVIGSAGCLAELGRDRASAPTEDETGTDTDTDTAGADAVDVRFAGVYAADRDREFIDGEYLVLRNDASDAVDVSGYVVAYSDDRTYRIADLVLEPGAQFVLASRDGTDATLLSSPPAYLRYAGFDDELPVLGDGGTVRVRNAAGARVSAAHYENGGCDGGSVTDDAGDSIECLHGRP